MTFNIFRVVRELREENSEHLSKIGELEATFDNRVASVRRELEEKKQVEMEQFKAELEVRFQKRLTELQERFFADVKDMFVKEVNVLKETYQSLIENIV